MNCPGWSSSGGPWITPEYSMKQFTWSETLVRGGRRQVVADAAATATPSWVTIAMRLCWRSQRWKVRASRGNRRSWEFAPTRVRLTPRFCSASINRVASKFARQLRTSRRSSSLNSLSLLRRAR